MPNVKIALATIGKTRSAAFDTIIDVNEGNGSREKRINALMLSPFDRTLFLDTDTLLLGPVPEIFSILDNFDIAMAVAPRYRTFDRVEYLHSVPVAYPRWNAGVIGFKNSAVITELWKSWLQNYREIGIFTYQPSLRVAIYNSAVRIAPISAAYNFRLMFPMGIYGDVKILHGRGKALEDVVPEINKRRGTRAFIPRHFRRSTKFFGESKFLRSLKNIFKSARK